MQFIHYPKKIIHLIDNYAIARLQKRPSTAQFWYLPEPPNLQILQNIDNNYIATSTAPLYPIDYRQKLKYRLTNKENIIVLPYAEPIGRQINPEAAFQYALGLHDQYLHTNNTDYLKKFFHYAHFFLLRQKENGVWSYDFDWFASKAPWGSALAQARGASVMLRAWLHSKEARYATAIENAFALFSVSIRDGGFLHLFKPGNCQYFEEYPCTPTGVMNGFMASLISLWEVSYWTKKTWLQDLWHQGVQSLEKMLPWYSTGWWSLYDRDPNTPIANVNSPRYHLLEIHYLQILSTLTRSAVLRDVTIQRTKQYAKFVLRSRALILKFIRKIMYR